LRNTIQRIKRLLTSSNKSPKQKPAKDQRSTKDSKEEEKKEILLMIKRRKQMQIALPIPKVLAFHTIPRPQQPHEGAQKPVAPTMVPPLKQVAKREA